MNFKVFVFFDCSELMGNGDCVIVRRADLEKALREIEELKKLVLEKRLGR